jgi:hypothetical protein
MVAT